MNRTFKYISASIVCAVITCMTLCSCSSSYVKLAAVIAQISSECPMEIAEGLQMTKVDLDSNKDILVTITISGDAAEIFDTIEAAYNNDQEGSVDNIAESLKADGDFKELAEICKETETNVVYYYVTEDGEKELKVKIPYDKF